MKKVALFTFVVMLTYSAYSQRTEILLEKNWKFSKGDFPEAQNVNFDDSQWASVTIPHDWAITGPFDKKNDMQVVAIEQNNEKVATEKTGRTGALPFIGVGWYRTTFTLPEGSSGKKVLLVFDGAMSESRVYVNDKEVGYWPYGYSYFYYDITPFIQKNGMNTLAVRLENVGLSSR